jgi:hypothetical protein
MVPSKPRRTLRPVTINPRGNQSDRVPGEHVYLTPAHNALASRMLIDQLTPHQPKDNEEVNTHVKRLQVMLDTTSVANPVHDWEDGDRGHEDDHRQSPRGDSANTAH